jgi:hypothetical protein
MEPNDMGGMTVKDLREAKGNRTIAYVQVAGEEEAIAASAAGMDMIGTAFVPDRAHFARAVPDTQFPVWSDLGQTHGFNRSAARCDGGYDGRRAVGLLWV